jgi:hypothetical protein
MRDGLHGGTGVVAMFVASTKNQPKSVHDKRPTCAWLVGLLRKSNQNVFWEGTRQVGFERGNKKHSTRENKTKIRILLFVFLTVIQVWTNKQ